MVKISVKKAVEEIEIGEHVYLFKLSDAHLNRVSSESKEMQKKLEKAKSTEKNVEIAKNTLDVFLDQKGAGHEIYETCEKSSYVLANVMKELADFINAKKDELKQIKAAEYTEE